MPTAWPASLPSQALGDLPAGERHRGRLGRRGHRDTRIVDMAPGAALVFHANGSGTAGHVTAVHSLSTPA
jgi:hypothetical protein